MPKITHLFIDPREAGEADPTRRIRSTLARLASRLGLGILSEGISKVVSVAEPAGHVVVGRRPAQGSAGECRILAVMSANLWHDWPRFRNIEERLESFARLVEQEQVDLVLLQELARTPFLKADSWLADRLGMSYVYSRANGSEAIGFEEGLGVYSRFPLRRLPYLRQVSRLSNPFVRRLALGVEVETPCGEILAFSVHLGLVRGHNAKQLNELHHWISRLAGDRSAVIGGDFNTPDHSHQMEKVRYFWLDAYHEAQVQGHSSTHALYWPWGGKLLSHRIDYIFLQPGMPVWQVMDVRHLDAPGGPHSDHRAVMAHLVPVHG